MGKKRGAPGRRPGLPIRETSQEYNVHESRLHAHARKGVLEENKRIGWSEFLKKWLPACENDPVTAEKTMRIRITPEFLHHLQSYGQTYQAAGRNTHS